MKSNGKEIVQETLRQVVETNWSCEPIVHGPKSTVEMFNLRSFRTSLWEAFDFVFLFFTNILKLLETVSLRTVKRKSLISIF